ncbi:maltotransferase domain-containing protein, partial [Streptomyces sp. NPDC048304]|uniref:maltotransferase domain-containing protein n=1 Tax=Streptomyces sp. NPDC048304 TaxID=3154820 RepID=UPI0034075D64
MPATHDSSSPPTSSKDTAAAEPAAPSAAKKPAGEPAGHPARKAARKTASKTAGKAAAKPAKKTATQAVPAKKAATKAVPADKSATKTVKKTAKKAVGRTAGKTLGKESVKAAAGVVGSAETSPGPGDAVPRHRGTTLGRIPVLDVRPVVQHGRRPAKAVTGESFEVSATVFREGHDAVAANVVLRDPAGRPGPWTPMRELAPGTDRWGGTVTAGEPGRWTYTVEAWSDPVATWRHHAGIKIPAGIDTELVLEEGARLYERAAAGVPDAERQVVLDVVSALRDEERPAAWRLAAALAPEVTDVLARHPLRELVTASDPMPLLVERERALYGSWYEFFPRSEGTAERPHG